MAEELTGGAGATALPSVDAIVIGRNEGKRLITCLTSLRGCVRGVVYVDSGSLDGSVSRAKDLGAEVIELNTSRPFTAARARNAGLEKLSQTPPDFVQFIDGDCELRDGWIIAALAAFKDDPTLGVACGRRRERFRDASIYNRLCDLEWDTPIGPAKYCGGDAMMRYDTIKAVGGFRDDLIAGEEPELCVRLRMKGWTILRLADEMTWHDADIHNFRQWFRRARRAGHAFAEGAALHGRGPERHWVRETGRSLFWGAGIPLLVIGASFADIIWLTALLLYPAQILRLSVRNGASHKLSWQVSFFQTIGKFPEAIGAIGYYVSRLGGRKSRLIEYK